MRPKFHYTARNNWLNDPNGLCYFKGQYHLYYQYNPKNPYWGNMSWGHATSIDLNSWTEHPVAMVPSIPYDADGCFSGSALVLEDRLVYAYTGIRYGDRMTNEHGNEVPVTSEALKPVQLFADSTDGFEIRKNETQIIAPPKHIDSHEFRDPKLFEKNGKYYFVVAAAKGGHGGVLFYESDDLEHWQLFREHFFEDRGIMWECPDYFEIEGQGLLIYSAIGINCGDMKDAIGWSTYDFETGDFGDFHVLDYGSPFYAPQTMKSRSGKRICMGWLRTGEPFDGENWSGMMSAPRTFTYWGGILHQWPHEALISYVNEVERLYFDSGRYGYSTEEDTVTYLEVVSNGDGRGSGEMKLTVGDSVVIVAMDGPKINVYSSIEGKVREFDIEGPFKDLRIVKDAHCIELFINDGKFTLTEVYRNSPKAYSYDFKLSGIANLTGIVRKLEKY